MMGRTHRVSGMAVGIKYAVLFASNPVMFCWIIVLAMVGSLIPDIDCRSSIVSKSIPVVTPVLWWVASRTSRVVYKRTKGPRDEPWSGTHRHLTHTAVFAGLLGAVLTLALQQPLGNHDAYVLGGALALGCLTHDLGDALTEMGCPFLWPLEIAGETWYEIRLPALLRFHTGGKFEKWVMFPGLSVLSFEMFPGAWPATVQFAQGVYRGLLVLVG